MQTSDRLYRDADVEVKIGHPYASAQIEDIIIGDKWPKVECKVCGGTHLAAIQKIMDTQEGGQFQFVAPECPNVPAEKQGE